MEQVPTQPAVNGSWPNVPLPGFYPMLTCQVNLTLHQQQKTGKFVVVVREPMDQVEIYRTHEAINAAEITLDRFGIRMGELVPLLQYLMGWEETH